MWNTYTQPVDDRGHDVEHLSITGSRDVAVIVAEDGVQQRRHEVRIDGLEVFRLANECLHQLQNFLLDRAQLPDFRCFGRN